MREIKKKNNFFLFSFQGRLVCRFAMKQLTTPEMNVNDDGEYLLMSLFRLEIYQKKINVPAVSVVNQNPIHVEI